MSGFCGQEPCPRLTKAVELFSRRAYLACHEQLEALWLEEPRPERDFYRGLLQIAVGLHHASQGGGPGSVRGATCLLTEGWERLAPLSAECRGLDLATLGLGVRRALQALAAGKTNFPEPRLIYSVKKAM